MLRCLEVSGLTRPARIRCRPILLSRPKSTVTPPPRRLPSYTAPSASTPVRPKTTSATPVEEGLGQLSQRRRELSDFEDARQLQRLRAKSPISASSPTDDNEPARRPLPSLGRPGSFRGVAGATRTSSSRSPSKSSSTSSSASKVTITKRGESSRSAFARSPDVEAVSLEPSSPAPSKTSSTVDPQEVEGSPDSSTSELRRNPAGVQLLSPSLHRQLFPGRRLPKPPKQLIDLSTDHLAANGLKAQDAATLEEVNFEFPPLRGPNIREHFLALGKSEAEPYLSLANEFARAELPPMPDGWATEWSGWTKYHSDGRCEPVADLGEEELVSFDVEVLYKLSPYPVIATAVTPTHWYSWLCPTIFQEPPAEPAARKPKWDKTVNEDLPHDLIPMFNGDKARIVIGHNVGFDRARIKDEYSLDSTSTRFLDTLSLHVATRGITSVQRPTWMKHRKTKKEKKAEAQAIREATIEMLREHVNPEWADLLEAMEENRELVDEEDNLTDGGESKWEDITAMNSLKEVAALHCGYTVDKSIRDTFGDESITHASQLRPDLASLVQYCADDVRVTHDVYKKVFPLFLESCPHPASFAGALSMGNAILPVNESWAAYLRNAEDTYRKLDDNVASSLRALVEKLRLEGPTPGDVWHEQLDWTPKKARWAEEGPDAPKEAVRALAAATALVDPAKRWNPFASKSTENVPGSMPDKPFNMNDSSDSPANGSDGESSVGSPISGLPCFDQLRSHDTPLSTLAKKLIVPLALQPTYHGHPIVFLKKPHWCFRVPKDEADKYTAEHGDPVPISRDDAFAKGWEQDYVFFRIPSARGKRRQMLFGQDGKAAVQQHLRSPYPELLDAAWRNIEMVLPKIPELAEALRRLGPNNVYAVQMAQAIPTYHGPGNETGQPAEGGANVKPKRKSKSATDRQSQHWWPQWYWDLTRSVNISAPGELDLTQKKTVTPFLLRMQWEGYPLHYSKTFKWLYRVPLRDIADDDWTNQGAVKGHGMPMGWGKDAAKTGDEALQADHEHMYFRLPHHQGEGKNVGNPLSKSFVKFLESGKLSVATEGENDPTSKVARDATQMSVLCSYWISARERIMDQMVVYDSPTSGLILPQVITMGTVTRRAVEATWLTAANAKKNRVGSELKAMVRAPLGYALVGADVDSEELWISSVMGDSQFGMHGATAIGWMTLEGTKSAGTDLHSKTASILGTSRDAAKVFNYSRIYGAGVKHAVQLLQQGDPSLTKEQATAKAKALYSATKGEKSQRGKGLGPAAVPSLWHGGSESYLFNTLEAIALSDRPTTPALGCGVTKALSKSHLDSTQTYLPSRINWVVQSSGVDYLHLLIVAMSYLIKRYDIKARYLLSVHDELRYLAAESDKYRTALALQIANAWTRALFCYNLGIDDVPQGVTFFSAVDIDHVLRKEVHMPCVTPSHPSEIPAGESLDIDQLLLKTDDGTLGQTTTYEAPFVSNNSQAPVTLFPDIDSTLHYLFLRAQSERHGQRAKAWLDRQGSVTDSRGIPLGPKLGKGQNVKIDRLRDATQHLARHPRPDEIREALDAFEQEMNSGRMSMRE